MHLGNILHRRILEHNYQSEYDNTATVWNF